ncbi:MAG: histidine phosphatase family protein [Candidatus Omnitrophica bacterium]|nr:histidine phosphatase family protein [Candidatus Omnitrophota bacterium]
MLLLLARHGETDWLPEYRYQGSTDVPLNEKGRHQTQCLVRHLASFAPAAVYTSPKSRTRDAAQGLASLAGIPLKIDERLVERHFGEWEGLTWDEIQARYPQEVGRYRDGAAEFSPQGGETLKQVLSRWQSFLKDLIAGHQEETVAVMSHGGFIRVAILDVLRSPLTTFHKIQQDPGAVNVIRGDEAFLRVMLLNSTGHLVENGVSWRSQF